MTSLRYSTAVLLVLTTMMVVDVAGHGSMITPRPRSAHNQNFDDRNKCGCQNRPSGCYSNASNPGLHWPKGGQYCGLGCIGEACLYYQIGCFQGCGTCSLVGKSLYPVPADLKAAGCHTPPPPTLGGGDAAEERKLRTYNIDNASTFGDWTKWNPWRAPGSAGRGNSRFQPCGINSGSAPSFPDPPAAGQPMSANGTDLAPIPKSRQTTWKSGAVVEAEWSIYANHGGGYSYRLCKKVAGKQLTEECYQRIPLDFATDTTEIKYYDGSRAPFLINATTTSKGTWPLGSQWRKNPIPHCNCDVGTSCGRPISDVKLADALHHHGGHVDVPEAKMHDIVEAEAGTKGKTCTAVTKEQCGTSAGKNTCLKCGNNSTYDCEECCPGLTKVSFKGFSYCAAKKPAGCSRSNPRACFTIPYPKSYKLPGQPDGECPTGTMFQPAWAEGFGAGIGGRFMFTMTDKLQLPKLAAGEYSLSWRWDCEQTPQVWNSCADITISESESVVDEALRLGSVGAPFAPEQ